MQIIRRGENYQLLRKNKKEGKTTHKSIGAFPATCSFFDDVDPDLIALLTLPETLQLKKYLDDKPSKLKKKDFEGALSALRLVVAEDGDTEELTIEDEVELLAGFTTLTEALCDNGYAVELATMVLNLAQPVMDTCDITPEQASSIMTAWNGVKKGLAVHGFTNKWFKKER